MKAPRVASRLKLAVVPPGRRPRRIVAGPFRGLWMQIDLRERTQLYLGLFEREVANWLEVLSRGVRTAVDVGAGEGEYTLYFLTKTQVERVFAFEPNAAARHKLMENLALNGLRNDPRLELRSERVGAGTAGDVCSLDSLLTAAAAPVLVKVDGDGDERSVLEGAANLLSCGQVGWIIETHSARLEEECLAILRAAGLKTDVVRNAWWRIFAPELRPCAVNRWIVAYAGPMRAHGRGSGRG